MPGDILVQTVSPANIPVIFIKLLSFSPDCVSVSVLVLVLLVVTMFFVIFVARL